MKSIRVFLSENFLFLEVKFSVYLNRRIFVMLHVLFCLLFYCYVCVDLVWLYDHLAGCFVFLCVMACVPSVMVSMLLLWCHRKTSIENVHKVSHSIEHL